jgi:peptidase M23B
MTDDEAKQQNSLVYYENTYLQNSGVLYSSTSAFDVICAIDGKVTNVSKDEILGNFVEITHNPNLKTIYYSLSEVQVKKDDTVMSGDVLGKSGDNSLNGETENCLLFEVYHNGTAIDPEDFYNMSIEDLK